MNKAEKSDDWMHKKALDQENIQSTKVQNLIKPLSNDVNVDQVKGNENEVSVKCRIKIILRLKLGKTYCQIVKNILNESFLDCEIHKRKTACSFVELFQFLNDNDNDNDNDNYYY